MEKETSELQSLLRSKFAKEKYIRAEDYSVTNIQKDIRKWMTKINDFFNTQSIQKDVDFLTTYVNKLETAYEEFKIFYSLDGSVKYEDEFEKLIPNENEFKIVVLGFYSTTEEELVESHANVYVCHVKDNQASFTFIEPHGEFKKEYTEDDLNPNHFLVKEYLSKKNTNDLQSFLKKAKTYDVKGQKDQNILRLFNIILTEMKIKLEDVVINKMNQLLQKRGYDVTWFKTKSDLQYEDEYGFCNMTYYLTSFINQELLKCSSQYCDNTILPKTYVKALTSVIDSLHQFSYPTKQEYLFQKGGLIGYFALFEAMDISKDNYDYFFGFQEVIPSLNELFSFEKYEEDYIPNFLLLKNKQLQELVFNFKTTISHYIRNIFFTAIEDIKQARELQSLFRSKTQQEKWKDVSVVTEPELFNEDVYNSLEKINQVLEKLPFNDDLEMLTLKQSQSNDTNYYFKEIIVMYGHFTHTIHYYTFKNNKKVLVSKEEFFNSPLLISNVKFAEMTNYNKDSHANALISVVKENTAVFGLIEPHSIYMKNEYNHLLKKLDPKHEYVEMFQQNQFSSRLRKLLHVMDETKQADSQTQLLISLNLIQRKMELEKILVNEIHEAYQSLNIPSYHIPVNINIQFDDVTGFCGMTKFVLLQIFEMVNECKRKHFKLCEVPISAEKFMTIVLTILTYFNKLKTPKGTYLFQKGGILGYFSLISLVENIPQYKKIDKFVIDEVNKKKWFYNKIPYDYIPNLEILKNAELIQVVNKFKDVLVKHISSVFFNEISGRKRKREEQETRNVKRRL